MAKNSFGLDANYFREKLGQLVRDVDHYSPEEMFTALTRLAETARPKPANKTKPRRKPYYRDDGMDLEGAELCGGDS